MARTISVTGGRVAGIALVAVVYAESGGSGAWVGVAVLTQFGTSVLVAPWAGAIGDRFDRRVVMIVCDLSSAAVFAVVALRRAQVPRALASEIG